MDHPRTPGCLRSIVIVFIVVAVVVSAAFVGVDRVCYHYLSQRLPIYPGAEVRLRTHNFISELGMGNTVISLYTPDAPDDVRSWYAVQTGTLLREWIKTKPFLYNLAQSKVNVSRADDGLGSLVILYGTCVDTS